MSELTRSESEILALISKGLSNTKIAEIRTVTPKTVEIHIHNIKKKLGLDTKLSIRNHLLAVHNMEKDEVCKHPNLVPYRWITMPIMIDLEKGNTSRVIEYYCNRCGQFVVPH